jgi:hypothetical protein
MLASRLGGRWRCAERARAGEVEGDGVGRVGGVDRNDAGWLFIADLCDGARRLS